MTRRALVLLFAIAACDQGEPTAESEVAAELRALRAVLVQRDAEPAAAVARPFDPSQLAAALSPLRDVLTGLGTQQAELQQRQLALTQEMQRWSQLLVDSVGTTRREEGAALTARLQQLETQLQEQKARTQQTEALLQNALDRTADRLEEFLRRVEAEGAASPASSPTGPSGPAPAPAPKSEPPKSVGETTRPRRAQQAAAWWWAVAAVVAAWCGFHCFRRWQRRPAVASHVPKNAPPSPPPERAEDGVQEIWAAAALLGEAVGRLRESTQPPPSPPAPASPAPAEPVGRAESADPAEAELGEFIVLDDELLRPGEDAIAVGEPGSGPKPVATVCHVPTNDPGRAMDQALEFLGADPRVLRRPEPTVRRGRDGLEIHFRAIPGLPPGEQSHLEQSLRDVCR